MKKRSAMFVAAGLVLAMIVAGVGFAMGMTGPTADAKKVNVQTKRDKPIVHTVTKTITIHKKAKATDDGSTLSQPVIYQQATAPTGATSASTSTSSSGEYEHESESESEDTSSSSSGEGRDD